MPGLRRTVRRTLSYFGSTRRRELGLRLALGAMPGRIVKDFLLRGLGVSVVGCAIGASLALAFGRVLSKMLYGISPTDGATFAGVVLTVMTVTTIASLVPAIRASRVDPMEVHCAMSSRPKRRY